MGLVVLSLYVPVLNALGSDAEARRGAGPRWYASIIDATRGRCDHAAGVVNEKGQLARPPPEMQHLLWPAAPDAVAPWVTEIGWTSIIPPPLTVPLTPAACRSRRRSALLCAVVPPKSDPQDMHADIVAGAPDRPGEDTRRQPGVGRYHHMAWKADHLGRCTTQLVRPPPTAAVRTLSPSALKPCTLGPRWRAPSPTAISSGSTIRN